MDGLSFTPHDRDMMVRTIIGEAGNQSDLGRAAVGSVILNRLASGRWGSSPSSVILAPDQFEPWQRDPHGLMAVSPDSPEYKSAARVADALLSGQLPDVTNGATHFYSPNSQAALGRAAPSWATGQGQQIGAHLFYAPEGRIANGVQAIASALRAPDEQPRTVTASEALGYTGEQTRQAPTVDSSDDIVSRYLKPSAPASHSPAATPPVATAAPASGGSAQDDIVSRYLGTSGAGAGTAAPATKPVPSDAKPGPGGLMWNADGGWDPQSGKLAVAGKPMTTEADQTAGFGSTARSGLAGFTEGLPIVGPYAQSAVEHGAAAIRAISGDQKYSNALGDVKAGVQQDEAAHPYANTAGQVAGGVVGTLPMVAAAPAAFGIGGASLPIRAAAGGATNALINGADAAVRSDGDLRQTGWGGATGLLFGAGAPVASAGMTRGLNALTNAAKGVSGPAVSVNRLLDQIGITPGEASSRLARLGPEATLADIDPAMTTEAGALAARGGASGSTIKNAMLARSGAADDRASQLVAQHLGSKPDLNASLEAIENDAATRAKPLYDAGRQGPAMDVTPILADIDKQLPTASGGAESVLNKVRSFLTDKVASANNPVGLDVPKSDPSAIHGARQALDDMISKMGLDSSAGRNAQRVATDLRNQIDRVVKSNPNFAAGDAIYEQNMGIRDAMKNGVDVFGRNVRPEDLQRTLAAMTPEQLRAYQQGARVAIGDAMEQSRRGELAGAQSMFARGSANRAKLDALFPGAQDALDALHSEATMRGTESQLLRQSVTAERQAAMQRWAPSNGGGMPGADLIAMAQGAALGDPSGGIATAAARRGGNALLNAMRNAASERTARGLSGAMVANGPEQQALFSQIAKARTPLLGRGAESGTNALLQLAAPPTRNQLLAQ